jgi:hypothetical protein
VNFNKPATMTRMQELADIIASHTNKIDQFLLSANKPTPSFDINASKTIDLPEDLEHSRVLVLEATIELNELLLGPKELLLSKVVSTFESPTFPLQFTNSNWDR